MKEANKVYKSKRVRESWMDRIIGILVYLFMAIVVIVIMYPVLGVVGKSMDADVTNYGTNLFPKIVTLKSYIIILNKPSMKQYIFNSWARTILGSGLAVIFNSLLAFVISRKKFLFKKQLTLFFVLTMVLKPGLIPELAFYHDIGLLKTFHVYILPNVLNVMYMLMICTYMKSLPSEVEEAAVVDGAGDFKLWIKIISPMCLPIYAVVLLLEATKQWNSLFDCMLYNRMESNNYVLTYELLKLLYSMTTNESCTRGTYQIVTPANVRSALSVLTMIPLMIIYPLCQRYFLGSMNVINIKKTCLEDVGIGRK